MTKTRLIPLVEFRRFLNNLGFVAQRSEKAWIFHHAKEGMIVLRLYGDDEPIDERDLSSTRKFLDFRGLLESKDFDAFLQQTTTPA